MHEIERLSPAVRSSIRSQIYRVLRDYATGGNHGPIGIKRLFLKAAEGLVEERIIEKPKSIRGQQFVVLDVQHPTDTFPNYEIPSNVANLMRQTLWELYLQGILAPTPSFRAVVDQYGQEERQWVSGGQFLDLDHVSLTPYGVNILIDSQKRIQVHDPEGYLSNFWNARPEPDPEMMKYLEECARVFRSCHLLASVVLLGIASERLIEVLALKLRDALGDSYGGPRWFQDKYVKTRDISGKFGAVESKLMAEYGPELDKEKLKDGFLTIVTLTFEVIRNARNEIAHPKGRDFTSNEVNGLLFNFVPYFRYVNGIIAFLADHPRP